VWDRYGSITGVGLSDRQIRDAWMADGTATSWGVLANAWKETVRDAVADIRAHREAAKAEVRRMIGRRQGRVTPTPQITAGVESETSNPDQHRSRNRKQNSQ
jgi:hypothetical protein